MPGKPKNDECGRLNLANPLPNKSSGLSSSKPKTRPFWSVMLRVLGRSMNNIWTGDRQDSLKPVAKNNLRGFVREFLIAVLTNLRET